MQRIKREQLTIAPDRQRGNLLPEHIAEKADSIRKIGLLHPPVCSIVDGRIELRAGETRLAGIDMLAAEGESFTCGTEVFPPGELPITLMSELTPIQAFEVELEENVKRQPLPWQREAEAYAKLHKLKLAAGLAGRDALRETQATIARIAPGEVKKLAEVHQAILLGDHMDNPEVAKAANRRDALKVIARVLRKEEDKAAAAPPPASIIHGDAIEVLRTLPDAHFDAIVTDPPYGVEIEQLSYQKSSEQKYDDTYDNWCELMAALWPELRRVLKPNASGYMFCDLSNFASLVKEAKRQGFECYPKPLIWDRSPDGRLTTPEKWPRRCYECLLYFRRGDRPLYEIRGDVLHYPADHNEENYHGAKKPVALFVDLLERVCRPGDRVLDAFAGSGPLLRAAKHIAIDPWCIEGNDAYFNLMLRLGAPE